MFFLRSCLLLTLVLSFWSAESAFSQEKKEAFKSLKIPEKNTEQKKMSTQDLLEQMEQAISEDPNVKTPVEPVKDKEIEPEQVPIKEPKKEEPLVQNKQPEKMKSVLKKEPAAQTVKKKVKAKRAYRRKATEPVRNYVPSKLPPPLPAAKPEKPIYKTLPSRVTDYRELPDTVQVTKEVALRVALEVAPPSTSFTVYEGRQYKDRLVYQVTFKTPNGFHDVIVDAENGDILKR